MNRVGSLTPKALMDTFSLMSNEDQLEFLKLLGDCSTAEVPFFLVAHLTIPEQWRFSGMITGSETMGQFFLFLQREARRLARAQPNISDDEFDQLFHEEIKQGMEAHNRGIAEAEAAKLKEARDRKSDPEIVRRNVEICNLRNQDAKKWTLGRLAKQYDVSLRAITLVLSEESKWRQLAAVLRSK